MANRTLGIIHYYAFNIFIAMSNKKFIVVLKQFVNLHMQNTDVSATHRLIS